MAGVNNMVFLYVHLIWSVDQHRPLLSKPVQQILCRHIQQLAEENFVKLLVINGVEDHLHGVLQLHPTQNLSQVVKIIKSGSSAWLNENKLLQELFTWEEDYAAYSVSPSAVKQVVEYINKQEEYHRTKTLEQELQAFERIHI